MLAATMLGMDDECADADELGVEALRETVSILCGDLLNQMAGQESVFDLGAPDVREQFAARPADGSAVEAWFLIDGHPLLWRAWLTQRAAEAA